jgi:tRNA A-37 threonylcarbamoyl transferase component Bud32
MGPPGQIISKENLFNNIHVIWNQIKKAHENNILHRDIRRSNIIEIFNNQTKR